MMLFFRVLVVFLVITGATSLLVNHFAITLGNINYWEVRGVFFLVFITLFPRLTLLFSSVAFGGFFWWLGFFFTPRLLVAILGTLAYWETNPVLVTMAWLIALTGETNEKFWATKVYFTRARGRGFSIHVNTNT
jgi:hypothetical protein